MQHLNYWDNQLQKYLLTVQGLAAYTGIKGYYKKQLIKKVIGYKLTTFQYLFVIICSNPDNPRDYYN